MAQTASKDFWIYAFLPFSAAMAASGTLISLFIISTTIGGTVSDIGFISALTTLVSLPLTFIWGKLTDDTGKRKIFILIAFISGFGILFCYFFAVNLTWLVILGILSGLLLGAGDTAKTMYIFDKYPPDLWEEKISKYQQRSGIGACLGLVAGGLFQTFLNDYALFFLICAILCAVSAIIGFFIIKDVSKEKILQKIEKTALINLDLAFYSTLVQPRKILSYKVEAKDQETPTKKQFTATLGLFFLGGFTLFLASNLVFTPLAAFVTQEVTIPVSYYFWIFIGYYLVSIIGYTFAGNWIDRKGNRKILLIGNLLRISIYAVFVIFSLIFFVLGMVGSLILVIILLIFSGLSYSLQNVALQNCLPRLVQKNMGEILAIYSIIVGISAIIGSFFSGLIAESLGYSWLFVFSVIFAGVACLIYHLTLKKAAIT
ncbi:MAG: MFS transporter [Candidatus Helarchaeota archaeon]|nr:MFS transporter [Candidatus Helarchaeota archaeon]